MQAVKYALLGLLAKEPRHGYELKASFEDLLGGSWPLNIGQVYSTLQRLERDGLVEGEVVPQDVLPDRKVYSITQTGRDELDAWLEEPTDTSARVKDEIFVKILIHARLEAGDPRRLIARQRDRYMQSLGEMARLRSDRRLDEATRLLVEGAMLHVEADLRWLELCEDRYGKGRL